VSGHVTKSLGRCAHCSREFELNARGRPCRYCPDCRRVGSRYRVAVHRAKKPRRKWTTSPPQTPREWSELADAVAQERIRRAGGYAAVERDERRFAA
jgi:hypothetical protein